MRPKTFSLTFLKAIILQAKEGPLDTRDILAFRFFTKSHQEKVPGHSHGKSLLQTSEAQQFFKKDVRYQQNEVNFAIKWTNNKECIAHICVRCIMRSEEIYWQQQSGSDRVRK